MLDVIKLSVDWVDEMQKVGQVVSFCNIIGISQFCEKWAVGGVGEM